MILQKYQALGNDFLILDCINFEENNQLQKQKHFVEFIQKTSDRRRIGCDQFIVVISSVVADAKIVFYNSDGSKAEACGNGTVACGVYVSKFLGKHNISLETDSAISNVIVDGNKATIALPMPEPIAFNYSVDRFLDLFLSPTSKHIVRMQTQYIKNVSVGNPHCVLIGDYRYTCDNRTSNSENNISLQVDDFSPLGKKIENMTHIFPNKTNVEFALPLTEDNAFDVFVWERGAGRTFACGTGACAVAFACVKNKLADSTKPIKIYMAGSYLYGNGKPITVEFLKNTILMTNHAFFEGKIEV